MPSVQTTTLNGLTSRSPTTPHPALLRITPVPISISPTHPQCSCIPCTPGLPLPSLPSHLQLRKQYMCQGAAESVSPHTRPPHSWYLPPNSQNGRRGQTRSVGCTASMTTDSLLRHRQSPWGKQRGRREYSGGFVMSRSSKVDPISCFS